MKKAIKNLTALAIIAFAAFSFTGIEVDKKEIKTDASKVVWKGYKVTGSHEGTIAIKSGSLSFEAGKLVGGEFVIDMTTINTTDLQGEYKGKLDGHLKSDDFFGVATYSTASLAFSKVEASGKNAYNVTLVVSLKT